MPDNRSQLTNEYVKKIKGYMTFLKIGAFNRFDINDNQIVSISRFSQLYSFIIMIIVFITGYTIIFETYILNNFLILPEFITIIELGVLNNAVLLNIHLCNRHSGAEVLKGCIEIDLFLGMKQTSFMRDIVTKDVLIWTVGIASFELVLFIILVVSFDHLPLYVYFSTAIYLQLLFTLCFDHAVHVVFYKCIHMRIHYLNVGLVKMANLNTHYLREQLLSHPFGWKKEYDNCVELPRRDSKYFTETLRMTDVQVLRIQNNYRFTSSSTFKPRSLLSGLTKIFASMTSLVVGTFLAVQEVIIAIQNPDIPVIRSFSLAGWFVASWSIFIAITQQTDKLNVQIRRTKLICTYILLKPNSSDELFRLSRSILDTLSIGDYRISIYNLFNFNQRLLGSIATSVFIYITMQLQIAFPKRTSPNKSNTYKL